MIKAIFSALCCNVVYFTYAQSYIDAGIKHYEAVEFEEALIDFNEAENAKSLFTAKAVAKLYFYKANTINQLIEGGKLPTTELTSVNHYFNRSLKTDSAAWYHRIIQLKGEIATKLVSRANSIQKQTSKAKQAELKIDDLEQALSLLKGAEALDLNPLIELKLAKGYHELGNVYFEDSSNLSSLQKAGEYYSLAIKYYEVARYNDPFSKSIIATLLTLSKRMDDPERVKEYTDLMALAGG